MNYDKDGRVISRFVPPVDGAGLPISYVEYRQRIGAPMSSDELQARDISNAASDAYRAATQDAHRRADRCDYPMCPFPFKHGGAHGTRQSRRTIASDASYDTYRASLEIPVTREEVVAHAALRNAEERLGLARIDSYRAANLCYYGSCRLTFDHEGEHARPAVRRHVTVQEDDGA